jgi:hypothetical protein
MTVWNLAKAIGQTYSIVERNIYDAITDNLASLDQTRRVIGALFTSHVSATIYPNQYRG